MAIQTLDFSISPSDGWVQVAVNPTALLIKPRTFHAWDVAVTAAGAPAVGLLGIPMGRDSCDRDEPFESGSITGEVYIRIATPPDSVVGSEMGFGILRDQ